MLLFGVFEGVVIGFYGFRMLCVHRVCGEVPELIGSSSYFVHVSVHLSEFLGPPSFRLRADLRDRDRVLYCILNSLCQRFATYIELALISDLLWAFYVG